MPVHEIVFPNTKARIVFQEREKHRTNADGTPLWAL
jgi:hypothetical protein